MNTKTLHLILLALFLSACGVNVTLSTNADKVVGASAKIADFDLPAGYHAKLSAQVMDYSVTAFSPGDG